MLIPYTESVTVWGAMGPLFVRRESGWCARGMLVVRCCCLGLWLVSAGGAGAKSGVVDTGQAEVVGDGQHPDGYSSRGSRG